MNCLYSVASFKGNLDVLKFLIQIDENKDKLNSFIKYTKSFPDNTLLVSRFQSCYDDVIK